MVGPNDTTFKLASTNENLKLQRLQRPFTNENNSH